MNPGVLGIGMSGTSVSCCKASGGGITPGSDRSDGNGCCRQGQLALAVSGSAVPSGWASAASLGLDASMYLRGLALVWVTSPASVMVASALPTAPALRPSSLPILVGVNS